MNEILTVKTKQLAPIGILDNAYSVGYEKPYNEIPTASFTLPIDDEKNALCSAFNVIEIVDDSNGEYVGLYQIMPALTERNDDGGEITYELRHVLATLLNNVLFRYHQYTNWTTADVLADLLSKQRPTQNWTLGDVDFTRYFHYKFENENGLLSPIFSVPNRFDEPYRFTYDTKSYPWTLNLVRPSDTVIGEIRYAKNMRGISREVNPEDVSNRIFALGSGEGVNQLGIDGVNPTGMPYVEDTASIEAHGLREYVWVDKRYELADSLYEDAQSNLAQWSTPKVTYKIDVADLTSIPEFMHERIEEGDVIRIVDPELGEVDARVMKKSKPDITGAPYDMTLEISNRVHDITDTQSNLERKQTVNEVYSQGSTNIMPFSYQDNADPANPAEIRFYLPDDLVSVNTLDLTYETEAFRAYSQATEGGGSTVKSTSSGGGTTATSSSGGGTSATSSSGGGSTATSSSGGGTSTSTQSGGGTSTTTATTFFSLLTIESDAPNSSTYSNHRHNVDISGTHFDHNHSVSVPSHSHNFSTPDHSHSVQIPSHTHSVQIPNHTHDLTLPNHSHSITLPDHTHAIAHGIYKLTELPSSVVIKVDGNVVPVTETSADMINLIPYLAKDSSGTINRGQWHEITITPDKKGRINANVISRLFIQSHLGGNY